MEVLYAICCGLDVHKASVTACLRAPGDGPQRRQQVRTFGTTTPELLRLAGWLTAAGCTHVAMESTGIYWRPVYNILEGSFELSVVNAQHVKMVPGRKTDVRDSDVARPAARTGPAAPELRAPRGAARAARPGPVPQAVDRGAGAGGEPRPEGPRDGQHQAGERRHDGARGLGARDAQGAHCGRAGTGAAGRPGPAAPAPQARGPRRGAHRARHGPPPFPAQAPPAPHRVPRRRHRRVRSPG